MQANADEGYYRQNAKLFSILSIEEPEAHLHLSLQYKFLKYLKEEQVKKQKVKQLFITTHSTEITSAVSLDELICLYNDTEHKLRVSYPGMLFGKSKEDIDSKKYVQRFLDAIKSDMLFADKVCFVEGKAEELLVPVMAKYLGKSFEDNHVAIISTGGRYFRHFLKLFDVVKNTNAISKRVVCITDRDPLRRKGKSDSFECCYPYEHNDTDYEYADNASCLIKEYAAHPNIRIFSQDEENGKTLEYDLMLHNTDSTILLVDSLSNQKEISRMQLKDYPDCLTELRESSENERIKCSLNACSWSNDEKKKALLASRYLNSVGKGENALDLTIALLENLSKKSDERIPFVVPTYIKDALTWLLQ